MYERFIRQSDKKKNIDKIDNYIIKIFKLCKILYI